MKNEYGISPLSPAAISYSWKELAHRAGISDIVVSGNYAEIHGIRLYYCAPSHVKLDKPCIIIVPCSDSEFGSLLDRAANTLQWRFTKELTPNETSPRLSEKLPVLLWGAGYEDGRKPFAESLKNGTIVFYADLLAATYFMLSRWEEMVVDVQDNHGRFPATRSVAYKQGFLDRPIIDEYALILRAWLKTLLPELSQNSIKFNVKLSHDVDHIHQFSKPYRALRVLAGDLLKRRSFYHARNSIKVLYTRYFKYEQNPFFQGIFELADLSKKHGFSSAFYFMTADPSTFDQGYNPTSLSVQRCIDYLLDQGHEVGFHPSYRTIEDAKRFALEKNRMDQVIGKCVYGGRQHYLRFQIPHTWRCWEQAGLLYDSTLGYADHEGFRCGTCHPYLPFDNEQHRPLNILEIPLIVMDRTLQQYRKLTPEQGEERILSLAQKCKQVNGIFTLLWHNTSLQEEWKPWAEMYRRILPLLAQMVS